MAVILPSHRPNPQASRDARPPSRDELRALIHGFRLSQLISVAARLGLPEALAKGPRSLAQLARATGTHEDSLLRLLRALCAVGIFAEDDRGQRYRHNAASAWLAPRTPGSLRWTAESVSEDWDWRAWGNLRHSIVTGKTAFDHLYGEDTWSWFSRHRSAATRFNGFMEELTLADASAVIEAFDFGRVRTIVDVAGGQGVLLAAILRKHRRARGIVLNLPAVIRAARAKRDRRLDERLRFQSGDFFQAVPAGADLYILKNILHDWDDARARQILRRCHDAMPREATLLVIETVVSPPNTTARGKIEDVLMLVRTGGRNRTAQEFRRLFDATGFDLTAVRPTPGPDLLIAVRKH